MGIFGRLLNDGSYCPCIFLSKAETTSAFAKVLRAAGPKLLTERYCRFLGIL